jgi:hypothetical protein
MTSFLQQDAGPSGEQSAAGFRASDADREAVVRTLHDAVVRGLLTIDECDERVAAAYAARFLRDLPPLTADLPPAAAPAPVAPGWRALLAMAWLQLRTAPAGISWRGPRGRRRLAFAMAAILAVLFVAAGTVGALAGGGDHEFHHAQFDHRGPIR